MKHLINIFIVTCVIVFCAFSAPLLVVIKIAAWAVVYACVGGVVIGTFAYCIIMCMVKYDEWKRDKYLKRYSR